MSKYQPTKTQQRRIIARLLWEKQGHKCNICRKDKTLKQGIIEHANRNTADYRPENITWVCYSCNQRKRGEKVQQGPLTSGKSVCVKISDSERQRRRNRIKKAPIEIEINRDSEPRVRRYLWENVGREGGLALEDAKNEAAEYADCSPATASRHIGKAASRIGPFKIVEMMVNKEPTDIIMLRDGYAPKLNSRLGQLDAEIMNEKIANVETELERKEKELRKSNDTNAAMQNSLSRIGSQREILARRLAELTGRRWQDILEEIEADSKKDKDQKQE